jgi:elongation factor P--beta-lysine ligase
VDAAAILAEWRQADVHMALRRSQYSDLFSLVITSMSLEPIARKARSTAIVLDAREAPAREAALAKQRLDDERQAEEKTRTANKKAFKP